jgi:hypothetical protein
MTHRIIGLAGFARVGKDTLASIMLGLVRPSYRVAFADALKDEVAQLHHVDARTADAAEKERIRPLLIEHGELRRREDPAYWMRRAFETMDRLEPGVVVVTDVRYPNEAEAIRERGGFVALLQRPGISAVHATEAASVAAIRPDICLSPRSGMWSELEARLVVACANICAL